MKKTFSLMLLSLLAATSLGACNQGDPSYVAAVEFWYSSDGSSYGNRRKEFDTNDNIYMLITIQVVSDRSEQKEIGVELRIPNSENVYARYLDGQPITPSEDWFTKDTVYNFTIIASNTSTETSFTFCFKALASSDITSTLTFDDNILSSYDRQSTIFFVGDESVTIE